MLVALRAVVSAALLACFYPLVLANLIFGLLLAGVLSGVVHDHLPGVLGVLTLVVIVWMFLLTTWRALPRRFGKPQGLPLDRAAAPRLWAMVDELSAVVGTRPPDAIYLVFEVHAAIHERSKLVGLIGGRRHLHLGMPLLHTYSMAQLRAVLAHQLCHYSGRCIRFGGVAHRGRMSLGRHMARIGAGNPAGWVLHGYAWVHRALYAAVRRRHEMAADLAAVRVGGRDAAISGLREMRVLDTAFRLYISRYIRPGLATGYALEDVDASFSELIRLHADDVAEIRGNLPEGTRNPWDGCPPLTQRLTTIAAAPEPSAPPVEGRPIELLPRPTLIGQELWAKVNDGLDLTVLPWDAFCSAVADARLQDRTNRLASALSRAVGEPVTDVETILDLIAAGRRDQMVTAVAPQSSASEAHTRFVEQLAASFSLAAIRSGVARWEHSWAGPGSRLIGGDGAELDLIDVAALACDPASLFDARARLAERGIDVTTARAVERRWMDLSQAASFGYVANCLIAGELTDIILLHRGLLLVPSPPGRDLSSLDRRLRMLRDGAALGATAGSRFIPFEAIRDAPVTRRLSEMSKVVLFTGEKIDIRSGSETIEFPTSGALATLLASAAGGVSVAALAPLDDAESGT